MKHATKARRKRQNRKAREEHQRQVDATKERETIAERELRQRLKKITGE